MCKIFQIDKIFTDKYFYENLLQFGRIDSQSDYKCKEKVVDFFPLQSLTWVNILVSILDLLESAAKVLFHDQNRTQFITYLTSFTSNMPHPCQSL